jgi:hypothetical protein
MAEIPNANAQTVSDGLLTFWNVDTLNRHAQLSNADLSLTKSATTPDPGANGTINTAGLVVTRIMPAAVRAGCILQAGTKPGQIIIVRNEAAQANSITFATSGTSNVADGANDVIPGGQDALYEWSDVANLWNRIANPLFSGGLQPTLASATAPDPGAAGTVATAGVGRARVSPAANRTGCILQAGTFDGQEVWVVNEAAANTIAWATQATSNIGGESGGTFVLAAKGAQKFVWDGNDSLWHKAA